MHSTIDNVRCRMQILKRLYEYLSIYLILRGRCLGRNCVQSKSIKFDFEVLGGYTYMYRAQHLSIQYGKYVSRVGGYLDRFGVSFTNNVCDSGHNACRSSPTPHPPTRFVSTQQYPCVIRIDIILWVGAEGGFRYVLDGNLPLHII